MELYNFLIEALKEQLKAKATLKAIGKMVEEQALEMTWEKHRDEKLFKDELEYELFEVKAQFFGGDNYFSNNALDGSGVNLTLYYFCSSKLPKAKRDKVEKTKLILTENNLRYLPYCNYKIPLWKELTYSVKSNEILVNGFRLKIE